MRAVGRERVCGEARWFGLAEVVVGAGKERGEFGRSLRVVGRLRLGAPPTESGEELLLGGGLIRFPALSAKLLPTSNGTRGWRLAL